MTPARRRAVSRLLAAGAVGAAATAGIDWALTGFDPGPVPGWTRRNFRGRSVTLTGGAAAAGGATLASALYAPAGWRAATMLVGLSAAAAGGYDDLVAPRLEHVGDKGWRGHLRAVRSGRPSGGVVKVAVIGVGALAAGRIAGRTWAGAVSAGALVAGTANLVNLFDLRPGRAGKVVVALAASQLGGPLGTLGATTGAAALAGLPRDLGETRMLGDIGANTLGALIGLRLAANGPRARWLALATVAALTAASERVSFTDVIARNAPLRVFDEWGRLPAERSRAATGPSRPPAQ